MGGFYLAFTGWARQGRKTARVIEGCEYRNPRDSHGAWPGFARDRMRIVQADHRRRSGVIRSMAEQDDDMTDAPPPADAANRLSATRASTPAGVIAQVVPNRRRAWTHLQQRCPRRLGRLVEQEALFAMFSVHQDRLIAPSLGRDFGHPHTLSKEEPESGVILCEYRPRAVGDRLCVGVSVHRCNPRTTGTDSDRTSPVIFAHHIMETFRGLRA